MSDKIGLFTDYYEFLMAQGVFFDGNPEVEFYSFFRNNLSNSSYAVFSGINNLINEIKNFRFSAEDIKYLESLGLFRKEFLNYLSNFSFQGDVYAFEEGDIIFPFEPVLKIRGTFCECTLLETFVLNCINFSSCVATKASRVVQSAKGRPTFEFAPRRAPYLGSANSLTYSSYVAGFNATSNALAGKMYNIPVFGTMAHSWIMTFNSEYDAFLNFYNLYPDNCVFLIDTYDTLESGLANAMKVGKIMKKQNKTFSVRIDSGDLTYLAKRCRNVLDANGFNKSKICLSNDLDENIITQLLVDDAPVDSFGVGTKLASQSSLGFVYKLSMIVKDGSPVRKMKISSSKEKTTLPGDLQVYRFYDKDGIMNADLVEDESLFKDKSSYIIHHPVKDEKFKLSNFSNYEKKLNKIIENGEVLVDDVSVQKARECNLKNFSKLHESHKRILNPHIYKVSLGEEIKKERDKILSHFNKTSWKKKNIT